MRAKNLALAAMLSVSSGLSLTASAQVVARYDFEEGSFFGLYGPAQPTVLDGSGLANHGYQPDLLRRMNHVTDAHSGIYAMEFNHAADPRPLGGVVMVPTTPSLEPATGYIEMFIKVDHFHDALLLSKATFQWLHREAGPTPPIFFISGQPRIVGRTVYDLRLLADGHVQALIGNDGMGQVGPWTSAVSNQPIQPGAWSKVAMRWNAGELSVQVNGSWSAATPYEPMEGRGLSYAATGVDPTYGPVSLDLSLGSPEFVGRMDDVLIASAEPCAPTRFSIQRIR